MPALAEAPADPFAEFIPETPGAPELIGGENGAPAFQVGGGRFEPVPRAEVATPTELGAFADLVPNTNSASNGSSLVTEDFGVFTDLVPQSPTGEAEKALAETPGFNPRDEQISNAPTFFGELQAGRIGSAYHLAKEALASAMAPGQKIEPGRGEGLLGTTKQIPKDFYVPGMPKIQQDFAKAFINVVNRTAAGLTTPDMLPLAVIGGGGGAAGRILAGAFGADIAMNAPETWKAIQEADKTEPWSQERFEAGLDTVMQGLMLAGTARHAVQGKAPVRPASEPGAPEATTERGSEQAAQPDSAAQRMVPIEEIPKDATVPADRTADVVRSESVLPPPEAIARPQQPTTSFQPEAKAASESLVDSPRTEVPQSEPIPSPERSLLQKLGGTEMEPPSVAERVKAVVTDAGDMIRDVVAESQKQGLVAPGTQGVQGALDHLGKIWKQVRDVPKFTDFRKAILGFGSRMQRSFLEAKEIQRNLKKAVPDKLAREGMFNLIEAGGDLSKIEAWRDATTDLKLQKGYQAALDLTPEQHDLASHLADFYAGKLSEAQAAGIVAEGRENYINRIVDKRRSKGFAEANPGAPGSTGRLSRSFKHGLHRVYESAFEAEQNGIRYQSKDVAELAPIYLNEMNKTIGTRELVENLTHGRAEDGRALAYPKGMMREVKDANDQVQARIVKPNFKQRVEDEMTGEDVSSGDYVTIDHPALAAHKWIGEETRPKEIMDQIGALSGQRNAILSDASSFKGGATRQQFVKLSEQLTPNAAKRVAALDAKINELSGKPILIHGDLALHPDIAGHVKNIVGQSAIRKWYNSEGSPLMSIPKGILRNIDNSQQLAKALLFSGSGFHHANIGFHAVEHRVNPLPAFIKSLSRDYTINPENPAVKDGMAHGLQLAPDQLSAQHFMEGFAGAGIEKVPVYGKIAKAISDHLFERFIPQLKLRLYDSILARNMKRYVGEMARNEITPEQVKYLSATQANSALSHLNYLDLGHNPTMRHIFSLTTMAPDFTESRVRFLSQATKGLTGSKAGFEQLEALVYGAGLIWTMSRVVNKVVDDDWHFEEPFGVVHNGRKYSFRSIQGDVAHMLTDTRKFIYGRISPLAKLFTEQFLTGVNYRGEKIGHLESLWEYLSNYVPISGKNLPGVKDLFETSRNNPVSPWESFLGAIGVQVSRYSPITKVYKLADDWKTAQGVAKDKGVYPVSKYTQLRYALEDGDFDRARVQYKKLIEAGEKKDKISSGFKESIMHPFTGSQANDAKFRKSLSPDDQKLYDMAVKRRHEILKRYAHMRIGS